MFSFKILLCNQASDEQQVNAAENASSSHLTGEEEQVNAAENASPIPLTGEEQLVNAAENASSIHLTGEEVNAAENASSSPLPIKKPATVVSFPFQILSSYQSMNRLPRKMTMMMMTTWRIGIPISTAAQILATCTQILELP